MESVEPSYLQQNQDKVEAKSKKVDSETQLKKKEAYKR